MVALSSYNKERVYFHLGYGSTTAIDAADVSRLEQACNEIRSDYLKGQIENLLDVCDLTREQMFVVLNDWYDARELFQGDINRASRRSEPAKQQRIFAEEYTRVTDQLALLLRVTNYNGADPWAYTHPRDAGAYIKSIPGPADTSTASRVVQFNDLGSGVGD